MKRRLLLTKSSALYRREFIQLAAVAALAFATTGCSEDTSSAAATPPTPAALPLGGAPDTPTGRAVAAFVDIVIPSRDRDPTGAPGAIDVDAAALFFDPELPAAQFVGALALILNAEAGLRKDGAEFADLTVEEREAVLTKFLADDGPVEFAVQLAKLAYFASEGAAAHLGYPGPNAGYIGDPDFSFQRAMSKEITTDGNIP